MFCWSVQTRLKLCTSMTRIILAKLVAAAIFINSDFFNTDCMALAPTHLVKAMVRMDEGVCQNRAGVGVHLSVPCKREGLRACLLIKNLIEFPRLCSGSQSYMRFKNSNWVLQNFFKNRKLKLEFPKLRNSNPTCTTMVTRG